MNLIFPDAQPYDTYLLIVVAGLIVWWNHKQKINLSPLSLPDLPTKNGHPHQLGYDQK